MVTVHGLYFVAHQFQEDEKSAEERAIDEWIPIGSTSKVNWWYSAFHNVTAMVGAGLLGFPYAMAELGW